MTLIVEPLYNHCTIIVEPFLSFKLWQDSLVIFQSDDKVASDSVT